MDRWVVIAVAAATLVAGGVASADEALAQKSGCFACHRVDTKLVGPAFKDVAAKYRHDPGALDRLSAKVKNGSKPGEPLVWGSMAMPPNPAPEADIRKVIKWVLAL